MATTSNSVFGDGQWFKGILHCHSTESDGRKSPEDVISWYEDRGYDFLSLTDHRVITATESRDGFLCIPGVELNTHNVRGNRIGLYHIVGIGVDAGCNCEVDDDPQVLIDRINAAGGVAFIAHPTWSGNVVDEEFLNLTGYVGVEIFNYGCEVSNATGSAAAHWDMLSLHGRSLYGFATDDAHALDNDSCGGWVMVKAEDLTEAAMMDALKNGRFYSSSGPEIDDIQIADGEVTVHCSPAREVRFITGGPGASCQRAGLGPYGEVQYVEKATHKLREKGSWAEEAFLRVEVVDDFGRIAWSNVVYNRAP